jgi:flagellar basal body-associated protein FliL
MAEKPEKKADGAPAADKKGAAKPEAAPAAAAPAHAKGGGMLTKTPVLLGGVMVLEAVVLFAGFKFLVGGAKNANAADLTTPDKSKVDPAAGPTDATATAEIQLLDARFPNKQSGRTFLYDIQIYLSCKKEVADKIKPIIADHEALIQDRVRTIIAQSDPDKLGGGSEPGLETLRRQVKYQLDEIVGDGLIDDVLIPRCIPFRTDY